MLIPGGEYRMGSDEHYAEERPVHVRRVEAFRLDRHPVTNAEFARFVDATGYVTVAERALDAAEYPQLSDDERAPGSLVFRATDGPVDLRNWRAWWAWQPGAEWRHPFGPDSGIEGKDDHPVVHVCFTDAVAYADWAGKRLPTEPEWEHAARSGREGAEFAWGAELAPGGELHANTWQGSFPYRNTGAHGFVGTSPVGTFPPNAYGLVDMIGNVWEWTSSAFAPNHAEAAARAAVPVPRAEARDLGLRAVDGDASANEVDGCGCGCGTSERGPLAATAPEAAGQAPDPNVRRVMKGGSHLCAPEYCQRYRPAARSPQTEDSATTHLGFRCAIDA